MTFSPASHTALAVILALGTSGAAIAQSSDNGTQSSESMAAVSSEDMTMQEKIKAADAPDIAETDPVNETASNEIGGPPMTEQSGMVIMDLAEMSHDIYERGYRQGYIRGVQEAREDIAMQIKYLAKQQQLMKNYKEWEMTQSVAGSDTSDSAASSEGSSDQQAASEGVQENRISNEVAARSGGTIVILPEGVSAEQFIERLAASRE